MTEGKANVLNGCDDYDGIMVFEVSSALCVGNYRCCRSMSFVYSEVYKMKTPSLCGLGVLSIN